MEAHEPAAMVEQGPLVGPLSVQAGSFPAENKQGQEVGVKAINWTILVAFVGYNLWKFVVGAPPSGLAVIALATWLLVLMVVDLRDGQR